jgi:hypothetical protein
MFFTIEDLKMPDLKVISLGAGVQSTAMLLMAIEGEFEKPDCAIFADTQWEPKAVYDHLDWLESYSKENGIEVYRTSKGNLKEDVTQNERRFASIPLFVQRQDGKEGQLKRQCTAEYKIKPVRRMVRSLLEKDVRYSLVEMWMGISYDEIQRMKPSNVKYIQHRWPLIERTMTREDCVDWMLSKGYERPPKSSCIGCPYHDNGFWATMKEESPEEFMEAVEFDEKIRNIPKVDSAAFLHRSLIPLREVEFSKQSKSMQYSMFDDECEGMCGV